MTEQSANATAPMGTQDTARNGVDAVEPDNGAPRAEAGEPGEGRRRGRGRDRNRRERVEEGSPETSTTTEGVMAVGTEPVAASHEAYAPVAFAEAEPERVAAATFSAPIVEAPVPAQVALPEPVAAVVVAPVPAPKAPAQAEPFVLPLNSLEAVAEAAGLQWVNSDADKIRAVQSAMANEPAPAHVPRERKPVENVDAGPLMLVETRKDLSQFKLPFETQVSGTQPAP